jgi:hypothetical protein
MASDPKVKNVAAYFIFPMLDKASPESYKTGETVTDTAYYKDGAGSWTSLAITDTVSEVGSTGLYTIDLTAAEMNHDQIIIKLTATNSQDQSIVISTIPNPANIKAISDDTTAAANLELDYDGTGYAKANSTIGTCTTNTDQRGTDSALLAASAPSNFSDLAITASTGKVTVGTNDDKTGYDLSADQSSVTIGTVTTLTGHTAQTGDNYARLGAPAGASVSADIAAVKSDTGAILTDTSTTLENHLTDIKGTAFVKDTHSLTDITADVTGLNGAAMRGTDSAALASVCTEGRLAELDAGNLPTDIANVKSDTAAILTDTGTTLPATLTTIEGKIDTVDTNVDAVLVDTGEIGVAGAGLTDLGGMSTAMKAEVESEANDALVAQKLDHLVAVAESSDVVDSSIIAKLASKSGTPSFSSFDNTTDSLEAISDGEGTSLTAQQVRDAMKLAPTGGAPAAGSVDEHLDDILADVTGLNGDAMRGTDSAATAAALSTHDGKLDTVDSIVDDIKLITDAIPDSGAMSSIAQASALATVDSNVDDILVDTGTTLPATLSTIEGKIDTVDTNVDAVLVDTGTTLPGILGTPAGASMSADIATIDGNVDSILTDTGTTIPAQISGLNDLSAAQVNAEVDTALTDIGLDHLVSASVTGTDITDNSVIAKMVSKSATADWDTFDNTTDALEAISDNASGLVDWTSGEREQIRSALGVDGTKTAATGGQLQTIDTNVDSVLTDTNEIQGKLPAGNISEFDASTDAVDLNADQSGVTVGTVTSNTDMRGTDNSLLAASAPANFSDLAITVTTGQVTVGTNNDKTGYDLNADQSAVTVGVCSVNSDMRGTDSAFLAASAPANFSDLAITLTTGLVSVGTNNDKSGYSLAADQSGVTIGTCNVNTDMRGTDSALLAASAPANFSALSITAVTGLVDINGKTGFSLAADQSAVTVGTVNSAEALGAQAKTDVLTEARKPIFTDTLTELAVTVGKEPTPAEYMEWMLMKTRNKGITDSTALKSRVFNDAGTEISNAAIDNNDNTGIATREKYADA